MPESLRLLAAKIGNAAEQFRYVPGALRLVLSAAGKWSVLWTALLALQGLLPVAVVYLTRELVDTLTSIMGSSPDWRMGGPLLIPAALMGAVLLLAELLRSASDWARTVQAKLVEDHISGLVHEKSTSVDLAYYESPDYHDSLYRAQAEAGSRPIALLENVGSLFQNGITLVAMAAMLIPYGIWMPIALVISTLPALIVVMRFAVRQHRWRLQNTGEERRSSYYDWLLTSGETAAELRLFGLGDFFRSAFQSVRGRLRQEHLQLHKAHGLADFSASATALVISAGCLAWMIWQVMQGGATLGDLALFYQAFSLGQRLVRSLLGNLGQIYSNVLFLGNLFEFLDLKSRVLDPTQPYVVPSATTPRKGIKICFHDVTFGYSGSNRMALRDFNLAIPAGQVVAIVGANGAGKSTLLKLLCRFYDPLSGRIEFDGIDLRERSVDELRELVSVLFQEPVRYNAAVDENIAMGMKSKRSTRSDIEAAARMAGADPLIAGLPKGYATLLGNWFAGGVELSVGEWQRIALARAFLRRAPVIVLDEPTSAMDSWAEADWLRRFRLMAAGRTAIIITHRFTTAMQADVIHVMESGRIVESGSHVELLRQKGAYAQSWRLQMQFEQQVRFR
jgi:ATP-binding cassette subfamily B protein